MKKLYALLLAGVLTVSLAVPTFATTSPAGETVESAKTVSTTVEGTEVVAPSRELAAQVVSVTSTESVLVDLGVPTDAVLVAAVDVAYEGEVPAGGVQIPFVIDSAKKGDLVYVLHRQSVAPYQWEVVGSAVLGDDLTVTATFTSFSPVAFMVVDAADVAPTTGATSPKTGE